MKKTSILAFNFIVFLSACHLQTDAYKLKNTQLLTPSGEVINTELAISDEEQRQGLSGRKRDELCDQCAMFFYYQQDSSKSFWMPDTYFDLDIFFLDQELRIVHIERNTPFHPGREEPPTIARTPAIFARHVLEMRSDSPLAKKMQINSKLRWKDEGYEQMILEKAKELLD